MVAVPLAGEYEEVKAFVKVPVGDDQSVDVSSAFGEAGKVEVSAAKVENAPTRAGKAMPGEFPFRSKRELP